MRLFHSFILFILLCLPFVSWYQLRSRQARVPDIFDIPKLILWVTPGYLLIAVVLYILAPTYREHIEPLITVVSLMIADGKPAYTSFDDPNIYSILYGPTTYLFQSYFIPLFSNPILGSKVYGAGCFLLGALTVFVSVVWKYGRKTAIQGLFYFAVIVLLFGQVSFRNQSDSTIILGNSLAMVTALMPSSWFSMMLLAFGSALSINAKFTAAGYILPLAIIFYRQHGIKRLFVIALLAVVFMFAPFLMKAYDLKNFMIIMKAYSQLAVHPRFFMHNLSTAFVIFLPLLYLFLVSIKTSASSQYRTDSHLTLLLTVIMAVAVSYVGAIDGAGSYHLVHFAPTVMVLYALLTANNKIQVREYVATKSTMSRTLYMTGFLAWMLAILAFVISVQRAYIEFINENASIEVANEILAIKDEILRHKWTTLMGVSDRQSYENTFYRPLLWPAIKDNIFDAVPVMGRQAVGITLPDKTYEKFANQLFDVVIVPNSGEPFSLENWHTPGKLTFGDDMPILFKANYHPDKIYRYFTLWKANRLE